jgi:hypothetical protein
LDILILKTRQQKHIILKQKNYLGILPELILFNLPFLFIGLIMKYTIEGLSQEKLIEFGLDNTDALIIRWFLDFKATDKMVKLNRKGLDYYWVKYESIITDLPCLGIHNNEVMARRFKKFINAGIMNRHIEKNPQGTFSCFNTAEKIDELLWSHPTQKSTAIDSKVDTPPDSKVDTKDSSTNINPSIIININDVKKNNLETEMYKRIIDGFYQYHNKQYKFDNKEYGIAKRLSKTLIQYDNWEEILQQKVNGLLEKVKENPKFWTFTIPKLEFGWNEFTDINKNSEDQTDKIINHLQEKGYAVK